MIDPLTAVLAIYFVGGVFVGSAVTILLIGPRATHQDPGSSSDRQGE